ncbi:MAG: YqgE/AlgH family protein [Pseudomonadota bacterium]
MELTGKLLVAMPGMTDFRFAHSVVYMCAYSDEGAMGLIVNKPAQDISLGDVLAQLDISGAATLAKMAVHFGGPVETGRGFVLHSDDYRSGLNTLDAGHGIGMTATLDVLEEIAAGKGPKRALVTLGYAGWGPGQLEREIADNGWLIADSTPDLVFGADAVKWDRAVRSLGVDPLALSATSGRA